MGRVGCEPSTQTYNCLLKELCYVGRVEEAFEMLMDINKNDAMKPDMYTYIHRHTAVPVMDGFVC
ncbi:hypothetical protein Ddye_011120 [Dipteronia dyeriana]|uniref:Pentatricopeptide repeat-containing protein n=1 Tax=Dipteronia dyeriana TaxID=168575 RepID=A0AAD9XEU2_9ROSI|nr:hypothetical protein Ddye_011120 [Dipteronia dyeriana]